MNMSAFSIEAFKPPGLALLFVVAVGWSMGVGASEIVQVGSDIVGEASGDHSGYAVALSGNGSSVAIAAPGHSAGIPAGTDAGHVRVFSWSGGEWLQRGSDIDGVDRGDLFGVSVDLSDNGNRLVVGAPEDWVSPANSGRVRVYEWFDDDWQQLGDVLDAEESWVDFGNAVAISADGARVAVGAPDGEAPFVRVFELAGDNWIQVGGDISAVQAYEFAGASVALSADGSRLAVGATRNDNAGEQAGTVRVYQLIDGDWEQMGFELDGRSRYDNWGTSVSLSSDGARLAVGGVATEFVRVYQWGPRGWKLLGQEITDESGFFIGSSVSLSGSGDRLAVGSPRDAGKVQLFEYTGERWQQMGEPRYGDGHQDALGESVSVSRNGNRFAVGAPQFGAGPGYTQVFDVELATGPVELSGSVETVGGTGICAMVLASGVYMFSCNPPGPYQLSDLHRESDGTVRRQVYARGFYPRIESLPGSTNEVVVLQPARNCPDYNPPSTPMEFPGSEGERMTASGAVLVGASDAPVCALVLINGASMFSCDDQGRYSLEFPLDSRGQYTVQVYASGFAPAVRVLDKRTEQVTVRMTRAVECD